MTNWERAVELADGFEAMHEGIDILTENGCLWASTDWDDIPQFVKDAIAAQLRRQVEITHKVNVTNGHCYIFDNKGEGNHYSLPRNGPVAKASGPNCTENTVNAILDSGVLENAE